MAIIQLGFLWSDCTNVGLVHSCDMIYAIVCIQYRESMPQKTIYTELYMSSVTKQAHIRTYGFTCKPSNKVTNKGVYKKLYVRIAISGVNVRVKMREFKQFHCLAS